jgi:hypothetical protein
MREFARKIKAENSQRKYWGELDINLYNNPSEMKDVIQEKSMSLLDLIPGTFPRL